MERIGQTQKIYIPLKTEVWGSFTMVQKTHLGKASAPCVTDSGYSYTRCMKDYVAASAGCHLDWVDKDDNNHYGQYDPCVTQDQVGLQNFTLNVNCLLWETIIFQVQRYKSALNNLWTLTWTQLVNVTGCYGKCSYTEYSFKQVGGNTAKLECSLTIH